jgi:hypothetical protein
MRQGRRLFRTPRDLLGLGPDYIGDREGQMQIWILKGSNVPIILTPDSHGWFSIVGEAYVHGVMDGKIEAARARWKKVVLR